MFERNALIFGASGAIGSAIVEKFTRSNVSVTAVSRKGAPTWAPFSSEIQWVAWDPLAKDSSLPSELRNCSFDAVIWAQGANCTDSIHDFDRSLHESLYGANVLYILQSLNVLLRDGCVQNNAKLCVISSIWQAIARQNKLSYCTTKSALQGMVNSLSIDLGEQGILVNAVMPGALDTPMTRKNLSIAQIANLEGQTPLKTLPSLTDVAELVYFLCSSSNTGITGQFIAADKGFSHARIL